MALPTLDATFASAADLPRRMMLAKWLAGEKSEVATSAGVLVSGAGTATSDGIYTLDGQENGRNKYVFGSNTITWNGIDAWILYDDSEGNNTYVLIEDVQFPWLGIWTDNEGAQPVPTVTEIPATNPIANYVTLPERYLWAKIAVAAGAPKDEAAYIGLPKQYAWKDIYDAVSESSFGTIDWTEKQALGHIAAAYRGDTGTPENLATYIDWPWRYQVASIISSFATPQPEPACTDANSNLLINNNILYQIDPSNGKPKYTNGEYEVFWESFSNQWTHDEIGVTQIATSAINTTYPWEAGLGERLCPEGDCGDYDAGAVIIDGRTLIYVGGTSYVDSMFEYIIYYDGSSWSYDQIGIANLTLVESKLPYPWLAGLGTKDCSTEKIPNAIVVSGAGLASANETYFLVGQNENRPFYSAPSGNFIISDIASIGGWGLWDVNFGYYAYASYDSVMFPWDATWIDFGAGDPPPTLTPTNV